MRGRPGRRGRLGSCETSQPLGSHSSGSSTGQAATAWLSGPGSQSSASRPATCCRSGACASRVLPSEYAIPSSDSGGGSVSWPPGVSTATPHSTCSPFAQEPPRRGPRSSRGRPPATRHTSVGLAGPKVSNAAGTATRAAKMERLVTTRTTAPIFTKTVSVQNRRSAAPSAVASALPKAAPPVDATASDTRCSRTSSELVAAARPRASSLPYLCTTWSG
mmetsp:Transcript_86367/g.241022  ORF Transcript_86367/g.241022 Transcript_86367/m.241022 type:complete len:219 (-) Transcript_86367:1275-1931(-)